MDTTGFADEMARVARRWRTHLNARFKSLGLTQSRWLALLEIKKAPDIMQSDLALALGIEGPTLVRILDGLEKQGLIERKACARDRRAKRVHVTRAAEPMLEQMRGIGIETRQAVLAGIPEADILTTQRVMKQVADRLENLREDEAGAGGRHGG